MLNTYETYVHEKSAMLRGNWSESDLVELIIYVICEADVRSAAMNANCKTISELLIFLSSFTKPHVVRRYKLEMHKLRVLRENFMKKKKF